MPLHRGEDRKRRGVKLKRKDAAGLITRQCAQHHLATASTSSLPPCAIGPESCTVCSSDVSLVFLTRSAPLVTVDIIFLDFLPTPDLPLSDLAWHGRSSRR